MHLNKHLIYQGNISESVGNLRFLTHLNLSKNELSGKWQYQSILGCITVS